MRPGHHRPIGTTTRMRFPDWPEDHGIQPRLGDVIAQETAPSALDHDEVRRAYRLVGVEETRTGYRLVGERIEYAEPDWVFHNVPREPRPR